MKTESYSQFPPEVLEKRAEEQRNRIAESVSELKVSVREVVSKTLDLNSLARPRVAKISGVVAAVALFAGYATAGMFTRH
jgi:hypothetical protein